MERMFQIHEGNVLELSEEDKDRILDRKAWMNHIQQDIRPNLNVTVFGVYYLIEDYTKIKNRIAPTESQLADLKKIFQYISK